MPNQLKAVVLFVAAIGCGEAGGASAETEQVALSLEVTPAFQPFDGAVYSWTCEDEGCESTNMEGYVRQESFYPDTLPETEPSARSTANATPQSQLWKSELSPDELVHVVIELADSTEKAWQATWSHASAADRPSLIQQRKQTLASLQNGVTNEVISRGGSVRGSFWSSNALDAEIPARILPEIEALPDVIGVCPAMRVTLDDTTGFQSVRFAAAAYMFGPENPFWEYH